MLTTNDEIAAHTDSFLARTLPEAAWDHRGHFAAALCLITRDGLAETERTMPERIREFNVHHGGENTDHAGYHHTITLASLRAAAKVLGDHPDDDIATALVTLMNGGFGNSRWLQTYWTTVRLMSPKARREWVAPDLACPAWLIAPVL